MLRIQIQESFDSWDQIKEEFVYEKEINLVLEHSLVSLSKWETHYKKPFLSDKPLTQEEYIYYIKCMTITQNVPDSAYSRLTSDQLLEISEYIKDDKSATTVRKDNKPNREIVTSELIYYWMFSCGIDKKCEKWHLSRLLKLIMVFGAKNSNGKKMSRSDQLRQQKALNAARRKKFNTTG